MGGLAASGLRRTKLICTLGPATADEAGIRALAQAGADVLRVNFSHGDPESHAALVAAVRAVEAELGTPLAVLADLPGPKVRLGAFAEGRITITAGERFVLGPGGAAGGGAAINYPGLAGDVRPGDRILLADGAVELVVRSLVGDDVVTECICAGQVRSRAGVNIPAERLSLPAITAADRDGLCRALDLGADLVAQSFVRCADDVRALRALMGERRVPIVAKIETRPAVENLAAILREADAVMVARGDLGVELSLTEIPIVQKEILRAARLAGKPGVVATEMLESMVQAPRPTRAEASDVANAVLDGADAIMLSAETAIGRHPAAAAAAASAIARVANTRGSGFRAAPPTTPPADEAAAVALAAAEIARGQIEVAAIACFTRTGRTALLLAAVRPTVPILAFVPGPEVARSLALAWGVHPLPAGDPASTDDMIALMDDGLRRRGLAIPGERVVMVASSPAGKAHTNLIKIHPIGTPVR